MSYRVIVPKPVQKQLNNLSQKIRLRLLTEIRLLKDNPRPDGVKKLKGYEDTYRSGWEIIGSFMRLKIEK